jgi:hypothetical protein
MPRLVPDLASALMRTNLASGTQVHANAVTSPYFTHLLCPSYVLCVWQQVLSAKLVLLLTVLHLPAALADGGLCLTHGYGGTPEVCGAKSIGVQVSGLLDEVVTFSSGTVQNAYVTSLAAYNGQYSAQVRCSCGMYPFMASCNTSLSCVLS